MHRSRSRYGERKGGSIPTIRAAGFSGIVATTWVGAHSTTSGRSSVGAQFGDTLRRSERVVRAARSTVGRASVRRYCIGRTIHGASRGGCEPRLCQRRLGARLRDRTPPEDSDGRQEDHTRSREENGKEIDEEKD